MKLEKALPESKLVSPKKPKLKLVNSKGLGLEEYLVQNPLHSKLYLEERGLVSFHWGDWKKSCHFEQKLIHFNKNNCEQKERWEKLQEIVLELKMCPVWVNNKVKTCQLSLFDLYKSYQSSEIKRIWFGEDGQIFQMSFQSEMGPYVPICSMRWFDKELFSCLVYEKILQERTQNRNFRLGLKTPINCHLDDEIRDNSTMGIHQIMKNGVLFSVKSINAFNRLLVSEKVIVEFNTKLFQKLGKAKDGSEFKKIISGENLDLSDYRRKDIYSINIKEVAYKYGNLENYQTANAKEFFIFVGFEDFHLEKRSKNLGELLSYFMGSAESAFAQELDKIA